MTVLRTEIGADSFQLRLDADDKPYVLYRRNPKTLHWDIAWAAWHVRLPTGLRARAVSAMGFVWRNDTAETLGWHTTEEAADPLDDFNYVGSRHHY